MKPPFKDHFSGHADEYARYRPSYPSSLFDWLAETAPASHRAWDCATGNGQAARALARRFHEVIATDASARQIDSAIPADRVQYRVAGAQDSGIRAGSCDLITVAQAAHWFNLEAFYAEVRRVARPGGLLVLWTYAFLDLPGRVGELLEAFGKGLLGPYWPPERALVESAYRTLSFPFDEVEPPVFAMQVRWTLDDLIGYLGTWSATRRYTATTGHNPLPELEAQLSGFWPDRAKPRDIRWPLYLRAGWLDG